MRKSLALLLSFAMVFSMFSSLAFAADELTAEQKFDALKEKGIFAGMEDGSAGLDQDMTRAQFARVAGLLLSVDVDATPSTTTFTDVAATAWYYEEVEAAVAAGLMSGNGDGTFTPDGNITVEQLAIVIANMLGLEPVVGAEVEGASNWAAGYVAAVLAAGIALPTDYMANATRELLVVSAFTADMVINPVVAVAVASVTATDVNKISVKFNQAITDTTLASFTLKRGLAIYSSSVTWSEDKMTATLESVIDLPAADYTVEVSGLTETMLTGAVTVAAEVATTIEVSSTTLTLADDSTISFIVKNQYGTDMEILGTAVTVSAYNLTQSQVESAAGIAGGSTIEFDEIEGTSDAAIADQIRVIVTYLGLTTTATVAVVDVAAIAQISFGAVEPLEDTARVSVDEDGLTLPYTALDQFGAAYTLGAVGDVTWVSSNTAIVDPATFAVDGDGVLTFDTGATAGTAKITAIINSSGAVSTTDIVVAAAAKVSAVTLSAPSVLVSAGETAKLAITAVDQFGATIANDSALVTGLMFASDTDTVVADGGISLEGNNVEAVTLDDGTATISVTSAGTSVGSLKITVEEAAVATSITAVDVAALYEDTATDTVDFSNITVKDQYARAYSLVNGDVVTVTYKDGTSNNVTFALSDAAFDATTDVVTFTGTSATANEVIKFALANGASFEVTLASVATSSVSTYELADPGTIFANVDAEHDVTLALTGKTASGQTVALIGGKITNTTTSNVAVVSIVDAATAEIHGVSAGTATISVWNGGTKLASIVITASDAVQTSASAVIDDAVTTVVDGLTLDLGAALTVKDQYGIAYEPTDTWTSSDTAVADVDAATGVVTGDSAGTATISVVTADGVVASLEITVTAAP